jgi:Na+/serine symporter
MILTKTVTSFYAILLEVSLWLTLLFSVIAGWQYKGILGVVGASIAWIVFAGTFFGIFLVISDIRERVKRIEEAKS